MENQNNNPHPANPKIIAYSEPGRFQTDAFIPKGMANINFLALTDKNNLLVIDAKAKEGEPSVVMEAPLSTVEITQYGDAVTKMVRFTIAGKKYIFSGLPPGISVDKDATQIALRALSLNTLAGVTFAQQGQEAARDVNAFFTLLLTVKSGKTAFDEPTKEVDAQLGELVGSSEGRLYLVAGWALGITGLFFGALGVGSWINSRNNTSLGVMSGMLVVMAIFLTGSAAGWYCWRRSKKGKNVSIPFFMLISFIFVVGLAVIAGLVALLGSFLSLAGF